VGNSQPLNLSVNFKYFSGLAMAGFCGLVEGIVVDCEISEKEEN